MSQNIEINVKTKDYTNLYTSCVTYFSGNWSNTSNAGTFQLNVNNATSNSNANITAHLLFSFNYFLLSRCPSLPWLLPKHRKIQICIGNYKVKIQKLKTSRGVT